MTTTTAQHTPGPWRVRRAMNGDIDIIAGRADFVATIGRLAKPDLDAEEDDRIHADADLIAAAPDMLEALQNALSNMKLALSRLSNCNEDTYSLRNCIEDTAAAIAKATG